MKTYNISLEESMNLEELDRERALKEFAKGSDVYAKLAKNIWLKFDNENDTHLPKLEDGIKYYISIKFDDDKLIKKYLQAFENGEIELSVRRAIPIFDLYVK